jgi:DNA-binding transcriptional MocR family regulator
MSNIVTAWYKGESYTKADNRLFWQGRFLSVDAVCLYIAIRSFQNEEDGDRFPSYVQIMSRCSLTRRRIANALSELERFGWIERKHRNNKSNMYTLDYPRVIDEDGNIMDDQTCPTKEDAIAFRKEINTRNSRLGKLKDMQKDSKYDPNEIPF